MKIISPILCAALGAGLLTGCSDDPDRDPGMPGEATVFAVSTDYVSTGVASTVSVPGLTVTQNAVDGVASTDPVVRHQDDFIYIVNRFGADNITVLDAGSLTLVAQISTGAGSNPQDVAAVGDKLYVPVFGGSGVAILDLGRPDDGVVGTVDLSVFDSGDDLPNCSSAVAVGDRLFVSCGVLNDNDGFFTPRGPGRIAVIDTATDQLLSDFATLGTNPQGTLIATPANGPLGGDLLLDSTPNFGDLTEGCLERIATGAAPNTNGCLVQHAELGGIVSGLTLGGDTLWMAVTEGWDSEDYQPVGGVYGFDTATMQLADAPMTPDSQRAFDVTRCPSGHLVVSDAGGGLRVYEESGAELTTDVLDIGLPPIGGGITCF